MAEGVGFEPTGRVNAQRFSRPPLSATQPSLRIESAIATKQVKAKVKVKQILVSLNLNLNLILLCSMLQLPSYQRTAPGETAAECSEKHELVFCDSPIPYSFVKGYGNCCR